MTEPGSSSASIINGDGFHVDLDALGVAKIGITQTLEDTKSFEVRGICGEPEQYGHNGIHDVLANFCGRWNHGIKVLLEDAEELRDALDRAAKAYAQGDADAAVEPSFLEKFVKKAF